MVVEQALRRRHVGGGDNCLLVAVIRQDAEEEVERGTGQAIARRKRLLPVVNVPLMPAPLASMTWVLFAVPNELPVVAMANTY